MAAGVAEFREAHGVKAALLVGAAVFLLNDFNLQADAVPWLLSDYLLRLLVIGLCLYVAPPAALWLGRPRSILDVLVWTIVLTGFTFAAERLLHNAMPQPGLFKYPDILDPVWLGIDTAIGIPLVALSEEIFCRGAFLLWAERRGWTGGPIILTSAALFGAIHWSLGPASITTAALAGVLFMFSLLVTRSLWPAAIAHWLADLLLFSLPRWQYLAEIERWPTIP